MLSFTETKNFLPVRVEMINKDTKEHIHIKCRGEDSTADKALVEKTLNVKEHFNISNFAYNELAQINPKLPCQSSLSKVSKNMNAEFEIHPTPGNTVATLQQAHIRIVLTIVTPIAEFNTDCQLF